MTHYVLQITRWVDRTEDDLEEEIQSRSFDDRRFISNSQFKQTQQKEIPQDALTTTINEKQFETIRKSALEVF